VLPRNDFPLRKVDMTVINLAILCDCDKVSDAMWAWCVVWIGEPFQHLGLPWLPECDGIVVELAMFSAEYGDRGLDLERR